MYIIYIYIYLLVSSKIHVNLHVFTCIIKILMLYYTLYQRTVYSSFEVN